MVLSEVVGPSTSSLVVLLCRWNALVGLTHSSCVLLRTLLLQMTAAHPKVVCEKCVGGDLLVYVIAKSSGMWLYVW